MDCAERADFVLGLHVEGFVYATVFFVAILWVIVVFLNFPDVHV